MCWRKKAVFSTRTCKTIVSHDLSNKPDSSTDRFLKKISAPLERWEGGEYVQDHHSASKEGNRASIRKSGNEKIRRRQLELLAEYSCLPGGVDQIQHCSHAVAAIHRELIEIENRSAFFCGALLCVCFGLLYSISVKIEDFRQGQRLCILIHEIQQSGIWNKLFKCYYSSSFP